MVSLNVTWPMSRVMWLWVFMYLAMSSAPDLNLAQLSPLKLPNWTWVMWHMGLLSVARSSMACMVSRVVW